MMYQNKKFAVILGAGQDGAGITRAVIEKQKWCKKNDITLEVYYFDTGIKWAKRQELVATAITASNIEETLVHLNKNIDVIFFHSFPRKEFTAEDFNLFYQFVRRITCTKVAIDHTTTKTSMNLMSQFVLMLNEMDLVYMFEAYAGLGDTINKLLPSKFVGERIKKTHLWFNFDTFKEQFNVPFEERVRRLLYVGRHASFKHAESVLPLGKKLHDIDSTFKTEMYGITGGISAKVQIYDSPYCIRTDKRDLAGPEGCVEVSGPYQHDDMMDYLSHSLFGISLFDYESNQKMEYAQLEMIACGCVPIFDKHWAETLKLEYTNPDKTYAELSNAQAIFVDRHDPINAQQIIDTSNNKAVWEQMRNKALEIVGKEYDPDLVLPILFEEAATITKDENRFENQLELLDHSLNDVAVVDLYNHHKHDIIVMNVSQLTQRKFTTLENKKLNVIQQFK